jgi:predicted dehydrogenase
MKIRAAVIGAGSFGKNHVRVIDQLENVDLAAIIDTDLEKAQQLARDHHTQAFAGISEALELFDAAIVATPTVTHEAIAGHLLERGIDVLLEKPIAASSTAGERLAQLARERGRVLQVGHLERFNPAVLALEKALTIPLFFEVHRLSVFTPRSLDIDVVLDLMIHDLDIVLHFTRELPEEIRAAGISVLSPQVDIANVRLAFGNGCIANLTASRVSTEKVRKLRLFQPGEYISIDYHRQDAIRLAIETEPQQNRDRQGAVSQLSQTETGAIAFEQLTVTPGEPLQLELMAFFEAVRNRCAPKVDGFEASNALRVAEAILAKIKEHTDLVSETIRRRS